MTKKNGRPTKLTGNFIERAEEVINNDINAIILTNEELLDEINEGLEEKARITKRTFIRWKKANSEDKQEGEKEELDELGKKFCHLIKKALREQKRNLFESLKNDTKAWQRFAWIIERKFDEWNIRQKSEIDMPEITKEIERTRQELVKLFNEKE